MSSRMRACAGSRSPRVHQPPSSAGPSTASTPSPVSVATVVRSRAGVSCGVSMPTSRLAVPGRHVSTNA
jgi:hypothetical protein